MPKSDVAIIGAGPAGLMAAEVVSAAGYTVDIYDAMPSAARKFLRAGVGGLNLTHSEAWPDFVARYRSPIVANWLREFDAEALRAWAQSLGIETFVGSSGRVFPTQMKAAPLLRAWLLRLNRQGVRWHMRHRWLGWDDDGAMVFSSPAGEVKVSGCGTAPNDISPTLFALGGGSWSRLGSDGRWVELFRQHGVGVASLKPSNGGFEVAWSSHLRERFAGQPLKSISASVHCAGQPSLSRAGECVVTQHGLEGGVIYALSAYLREQIADQGSATLYVDLAPQRTQDGLRNALKASRGRDSLANHLRRCVGITGVKAALLREVATPEQLANMDALAALIKAVPVVLIATRPIDEAISTAGGIGLDELDAKLSLKKRPGIFCAGEMLDWEAPTGGYLLTACMASGVVAGRGMLEYLASVSATQSAP